MKDRATFRRRVQRPWLSLALLAMLLLEVPLRVFGDVGVPAPTTASNWLRSRGVPIHHTHSLSLYFVRENGGGVAPPTLVPLFRDGESADRMTKAVTERPGDVLAVILSGRERSGLWVSAYETRPVTMQWLDGGAVDDATRGQAAESLAREFEGAGDVDAAAELREHPRGTKRVLWRGVAYNAIWAGVVAAIVFSLGWLPAWVRTCRRQPWQCPRCGYDLRGIASATCPECGEPNSFIVTQAASS